MNINEFQTLIAQDQVREGLLKTTEEGWSVALEDMQGHQYPLTDSQGHEKHYHSLDNATALLHKLGVERICIVEAF